jgi:hypothetical protein
MEETYSLMWTSEHSKEPGIQTQDMSLVSYPEITINIQKDVYCFSLKGLLFTTVLFSTNLLI